MADRDAYQQAMNEAASAAWDHDWGHAVEVYERALQIVPDDAQALAGLALCLFELGELDQALNTYQRVRELVPSDPLPLEKMAEIHESRGEDKQAARRYLEAGEIFFIRKDFQRAIPNWERATALDMDLAQAHLRLAMAFERDKATHHQAVHEYLQVGRLLQQYGQTQRAEQALQRALSLDPIGPEVRNALDDLKKNRPIQVMEPAQPAAAWRQPEGPASGAAVRGEEYELLEAAEAGQPTRTIIDEAARFAMGVLADSIWSGGVPPQAQALLVKAIDAHQVGDGDTALTAYEQALKAGLTSSSLRFCLGLLYHHQRRFEDAVEALRHVAEQDEYAAPASLMLGEAYFALDRVFDAATHLTRALRAVDRLVNQGEVDEGGYERLLVSLSDQPDAQRSDLVRALTFYLNDPQMESRLQSVLESYQEQGKQSYATDLVNLLIEGGRPEVAAAMQRIDDYLDRDLLHLASDEIYYAIERAPDYLPAHRRLADLLVREGRAQEAATKINLIATTYLMRGNSEEAADLFIQVIDLWPADTAARQRVIDMLRQQGRVDEALYHYTEMGDLYYRLMADPDRALAVFGEALQYARQMKAESRHVIPILKALADIESQRLNWSKALTYYERVAELEPADQQTALAVVELHFQLSQNDEAVRALDRFIRHCLEQGDLQQATDVLAAQVQRRPQVIPLRQRLADLYRQQGRTQDAITQMDALGELQLDAGQLDDAIATIRQIVEMGPPDVEGYRRLLEQLETGSR